MTKASNKFIVKSEVWLYPGMEGNWHFVSLSKKHSDDIKRRFGANSRGWGSLPVFVTLGKTCWKTSIFPHKQEGVYILPLKAMVRKKEGIYNNDKVNLILEIKTN